MGSSLDAFSMRTNWLATPGSCFLPTPLCTKVWESEKLPGLSLLQWAREGQLLTSHESKSEPILLLGDLSGAGEGMDGMRLMDYYSMLFLDDQ